MQHIILDGGDNPNSRGFFSFVIQYLSAYRYYKDNNDVHISFDLNMKSKYYDSSIKNTFNVWDYFFVTPKVYSTTIQRTTWGNFGNFYGYTFNFDNYNERVLSESIIKKHLLVKPEITEKIDEFYEKNFKNKTVLGIHKRGTDIWQHHKMKELNEYLIEIDSIAKNYDTMFLSTDEKSVVDFFKTRYSNITFYSYESLSIIPSLPNFKNPTVSGYKMGEDCLIDAFLLSKTNFLIHTNSNLSNFSLLANSNLKSKKI